MARLPENQNTPWQRTTRSAPRNGPETELTVFHLRLSLHRFRFPAGI